MASILELVAAQNATSIPHHDRGIASTRDTPQDQGAQAQQATKAPNTPSMRGELDAQINEGAKDAQERGEQQREEENQQTATAQPNEASP